jgi:membrane-associated phospholipid phosphatase
MMERGVRRKFSLSTLLVLINSLPIFTQNKYNFPEFEIETIEFIKQPVKWSGIDWLKIGILGGSTLLMAQADRPLYTAALKKPQWGSSLPIRIGATWGGWYPAPILIAAFGLHGWLADNTSTKKIAFEMTQSVLYAELVKSLFTVSVGRARPYVGKGNSAFRPFTLLDRNYQSFPGGHCTAGFALSTVLAGNTRSVILKMLAYVPAGLTAIARTYQGAHWASDDLFGAALGSIAGIWVLNLHKRNSSRVRIVSICPPAVGVDF